MLVKSQDDGRYVIRLLANMNKSSRSALVPLALELTQVFDHYLDFARPRLLKPISTSGAELPAPAPHDYLFVKRNGSAPRASFASCTQLITQHVIGRPVTAHIFRAAVITTFYAATNASQTEMDTLAAVICHDPQTAKRFYWRPILSEAAVNTNDKMTRLLLS